MSGVWFTADTHFGHRAMPRDGKGWRAQYATVAEHDADLIEQWNATVRPGDTVWHLGDFAIGRPDGFLPIVGKLHGAINLVAGNHDVVWHGHRDAHKHHAAWLAAGFASIQAHARRRVSGRNVLLSHLPYSRGHVAEERYTQWRLPDLGLPMLCGHVHDAWPESGRQFNVGVDVRKFRPVSLGAVTRWVEALPATDLS